jgi:hypothetical protein
VVECLPAKFKDQSSNSSTVKKVKKIKIKNKTQLERIEVHYLCTCEDSIMNSTKHCLKRRVGMGKWTYNGGGKLELVQGTLYVQVWNYHNEIPLY